MNRLDGARTLTEVRAAVLATLGEQARTSLRDAVARHALDVGQFEASVRPSGAALRGGRMMIERVPLEVVEALCEALHIELPPLARRLATAAAAVQLPLIAGWDLREDEPCAKLYLNASDASETTRRALRERFGIAADEPSLEAPAVIGFNAHREGPVELKLYVQHRDPLALARPLGTAAIALAERALDEGAAASAVASWDVDGGRARARAFFVALRDPGPGRTWGAVSGLNGWDEEAARRAVPFPHGPPRSVGVAVDSADRWTVYVKPIAGDRPPHTLEPTASFRAGSVEVGVFIEPSSTTERAYARTEGHAISVRSREGRASRDALARLLEWVTRQVICAEQGARAPVELLGAPPSPWRRVS